MAVQNHASCKILRQTINNYILADLTDCDTGEHIQLEDKTLKYIPFPVCNETGKPLELKYGVEEELNCTIPLITDPFFHLLEFYIHNDAPLTCRLPARPPPSIIIPSYKQPYVPLIFALAGTLQRSHLHISTHLNILLHSTPKHHVHKHDSGVIDSGAAYSTSPLSHVTGPKAETKKLIIGDRLPLMLSVRWFPSPRLPRENGVVEWNGLGGHVTGWMVWYCVLSFVAGGVVVGAWMINWEVPRRMKGWGARMARNGYGYGGANGKTLGGATPLGYGLGSGGGGVGGGKSASGGAVGNGWGFVGGGGAGGYADGKRD
ncbi:glucose-6-phosphate isomerase protein [Rutstroemia sp. NJR-2017a WRK4]|nr:glucose-6-phosphate isomerase protein [Rutstroemia sp. NJR-2017a WRK4]